jgi:hypothetical protein
MKRRIKKRGSKKHHTVQDYMKLSDLAMKAPFGPVRNKMLDAADKMEHDLLMRGEYHRRRKNRGKR